MQKPTILIVDDDRNNLALLNDLLIELNYTVIVAEDGEAAVARAIYALPELILLDTMMPGIDGYETCRRLKSHDTTKHIPVIFITALSDAASVTKAFGVGAVDHVTKPFIREVLLARVEVHLKNSELLKMTVENGVLLKSIYDSVRDSILVFDPAGVIIDMNSTARGLFDSGILADTVYDACTRLVEESFVNKATVKQRRLAWGHARDHHRVVSMTASPLVGNGAMFGTILVICDETQIDYLELSVEHGHRYNMIGVSEHIQKVYSVIDALAPVNTTVLITGESGTGKELVARAIHSCSMRAGKPFVALNCAALSDDLLSSELFGHVKGAFTGATSDRKGRFEIADKGTLFLDEIGDISQKMQVMLLRVIQEQEFERSGDSSVVKVDVRIIAATNKGLFKAVKEGSFREDLYYRLNVYPVHVPPLRERGDDIPLLASYFSAAIGQSLGKNISVISDDAVRLFLGYPWPGNIRELRNVIEYAVIKCSVNDISILPEHLPVAFQQYHLINAALPMSERDRVVDALVAEKGNKRAAANRLGIDRSTLYRKLEQFGIA